MTFCVHGYKVSGICVQNNKHSNTFSLQLNTGQAGVNNRDHDLKVEQVWLQGVSGCDTVVAIVDDGKISYS